MTKTENKKYRTLIETGKELFFRHGIKRVTIEEICEKSDVSKMTYYKHFSNKRDLVISILDEIVDDAYKKFNEIIEGKISYREKIKEVIKMKLDMNSEYSDAFTDEAVKSDSYIYKHLISKSQEQAKAIEVLYNMGIKEGTINSQFSKEFFIHMLYKAGDFFSDESVVKIYPDKDVRLSVVINFFFFGLMGKSE
jgi:AcrR family transcriptional regulator